MRLLTLIAASAALLALPAAADDKLYPHKVETNIQLEGLDLKVVVKQGEEYGVHHYIVTASAGVYVGTGDTLSDALDGLKNDYTASGSPEGPLPPSLALTSRADGSIGSVEENGTGEARIVRVTLSNFPGMVFIIHDWAASYSGETFEAGANASFAFAPTDEPGEVLVVSTSPDGDEDSH
ncbi:MAG: hypothetical protein EON60_07710 [Alphaproteobacteria bacterium]|nr:MAG: hypothetical protein EON60_07710 [Alphaproteobacteria bacterium]